MQELFTQSYTIISKYISLLFDMEQLNKLISNYKLIFIKKSITTNTYKNTDVYEKTDIYEKTDVRASKEDDMNDFIWGTYIQS